ncbi:DUF397 domain-containing protein [Streptomyces sp. NPDC020917]|uniref:DUF397 domain-containing protein n=1 Tax=Streptomyces sp. NPDC020917 TaxID=3365102 RepID=UPI0037916F02
MNEQTIPHASALTGWRKSSRSGNNNDSCLEVVDDYPAGVPVRDSKDPEGPALVFPRAAWAAFISAVKRGDLGA